MAVTTGCHSDEQLAQSLAAHRPRGDAWRHGGFDALDGSGMGAFFAGLGAAFGPLDRRVCDMVDQFFCSTATETLDIWAREYGVPDGCDPFADICEKVNAVGDTIPAYAEAAALRRGWSITIAEEFTTLVEDCCMGMGLMGTMIMGAAQGVTWRIVIDRAKSPAYQVPASTGPIMGLMLMADALDCDPDNEGLRCLIRRIAPAHADLVFETIN
ncbi:MULTISPECIES: DUF2313 domain-containing protein [unclassified Bosea (in: a-proteobacteria)]|uniref:DUF2313 domain-containing protein n=1 Tax=unclassified Bosea (in: a-proteobacteria) TaxID=2653178 RepID=UPI000F74E68A|nr:MULTISPECIES: DUF2313 domain-containing protein [unclassified Bosea (in: a-proteobacteria)]AZO77704.1 hypothetical protein BLM15_08810 [Bosea sp. Tri-49]RXT18317.1 hypothetical protein B5U98_23970 [Bosea sp. Tri-39]RXT32913.1 hypothetical protein B5U99_30315 [Bosea sp. Tri-54]